MESKVGDKKSGFGDDVLSELCHLKGVIVEGNGKRSIRYGKSLSGNEDEEFRLCVQFRYFIYKGGSIGISCSLGDLRSLLGKTSQSMGE